MFNHHACYLAMVLALQHEAAAAGAASAVAGPGLQATGPSLRASSLQGHLGADGAAAAGPAAGLTPLAAPAAAKQPRSRGGAAKAPGETPPGTPLASRRAAGSRSAGTPASVDGDPGRLSCSRLFGVLPHSIQSAVCIVLCMLHTFATRAVLMLSATTVAAAGTPRSTPGTPRSGLRRERGAAADPGRGGSAKAKATAPRAGGVAKAKAAAAAPRRRKGNY
jgi:hypothetical protein